MLPNIFCTHCKHILDSKHKLGCKAFPNGIPYEILFASQLHSVVLADQEGEYIFTPQEGDENFIPKKTVTEEEIKLPPLSELFKKLRENQEKD